MYTVIGNKKSRAFRVLWALEELGLDYELDRADPRSERIRQVNPSGKVPALLADGRVILDSVAIVTFLADRHGGLTHRAGTLERAEQDSFTHFICDEIDGCLWTAARHSFVLPEEMRVPDVKPSLRWEFARSMDTLSKRLGQREWLTGDGFTIPDLLLAHCGSWARTAKFEIAPDNVNALIDRALARPAWKRAAAV